MGRKYILIVLIIVLIAILGTLSIFSMNFSKNYPTKFLGANELGNVSIEGPYGNKSSPDKIAFIIGVHPLENNSHQAILNLIREKNKRLKSCYYIYIINVTKDKDDFDKGRVNGQVLASKYVVSDVIKKNYSFVVDIHSHRGVYEKNNFLIAPLNDNESEEIGLYITKNIKGMEILKYIPADDGHPTSPEYVSIPILNNGTSTLIYETYLNESSDSTNYFMAKFLENLDLMNFNNV